MNEQHPWKNITQPDHGFFDGAIIYLDEKENAYKLACADKYESSIGCGIARVHNKDCFDFASSNGEHFPGMIELSIGKIYFLSDEKPGHLCSEEPTKVGHFRVPLFLVLDPFQNVCWVPWWPMKIKEEGADESNAINS